MKTNTKMKTTKRLTHKREVSCTN